ELVSALGGDAAEELDLGVAGGDARVDGGLDVTADGRQVAAAQQRRDDADDVRVRVVGAHGREKQLVRVAERVARVALVVADVVGAKVDDHGVRLDVEVPCRGRGVGD